MFGGKRGTLASWRTQYQPWRTGVAASCCECATSQDISQDVTFVTKLCLPNGQWSQAYYQSQGIGVAITKPWPQFYRIVLGRTEKACVSKEAYKPDSVTQAIRRNWSKFTQFVVGSVWKGTRNVWPKLNNLKAMLPSTNWVYVNFWPTGNVMKKIQAEINHYLYYYSDISHS